MPQWNCACPNCRKARVGQVTRTQSAAAVSADGERWVLLNASPDLRQQLAVCPRLWPVRVRASPLRAVVLTDAELDHTAGLALLREGTERLPVYASAGVLELLGKEWPLLPLLERYGGTDARALPDGVRVTLTDSAGAALGLFCTAVALPGAAPRYANQGRAQPSRVGLRVEQERGGAVLAYVPTAGAVDERVRRLAHRADLLCFDGTFWADDELRGVRPETPTARAMGHLPVGGADGGLESLPALGAARTILVHVNNTNPILDPSSAERQAVDAAGLTVAEDGMEFEL